MISSTVMRLVHCTVALLLTLGSALAAQAQEPGPPPAGSHAYAVFLRGVTVGREDITVMRGADGLTIIASGRLGVPLDSVLRLGQVRYDATGEPVSLKLEGAIRGVEVNITSTFAGGIATSEITQGGQTSQRKDAVSPRALVVPNGFFGAYAALADRLRTAAPGSELHLYIAPRMEIGLTVGDSTEQRIDAPGLPTTARRVHVVFHNPDGDVPGDITIDAAGNLLRLTIPSQSLDIAREELALANARTAAFSLPGDEPVKIIANGFTLAGTVTKPSKPATPRLPALVLVAGSGPLDREEVVAGIPLFGQMARALVDAGFLVIRYDKRGIGQSGGRAESATLSDFADDVVAIVRYLGKRPDVNPKQIAVVGHSEGAWVALLAAAREKDIAALASIGGAAVTGSDLVLEQQRHALERSTLPEDEKVRRVELQKRIQRAVLEGAGWEGVPAPVRKAADTPWFQSLLAFDPAKAMKETRQPILVVHGELDRQVPVAQADQLAALARGRKKGGAVEEIKLPGLNHLLVPATTGEVVEYPSLPDKNVSAQAMKTIADWLQKTLATAK